MNARASLKTLEFSGYSLRSATDFIHILERQKLVLLAKLVERHVSDL